MTEPPSDEPYFGCFTGDCPHDTQAECDAAIKAEVALLERTTESQHAELAALRAALEAAKADTARLDWLEQFSLADVNTVAGKHYFEGRFCFRWQEGVRAAIDKRRRGG